MYKAPSNILFKKEKRLDEDIIRTKDLIYRIVRVGLGVICILRSRKANDKNFKGQKNVGQQPPSQPPIEESFQKTKRMVDSNLPSLKVLLDYHTKFTSIFMMFNF